jgi:hypothetical protein
VLRWYPAAWRQRYGEELAALIEDTYPDGRIPWPCRLALLRAGLTQRLRAGGLFGQASPAAGARAGSLLVLWAWAVFMVAGAGFANLADGWYRAVPAGARALPRAGYGLVYAAAVAGGAVVLLAACVCAPAVAGFLRRGGWPQVRRLVLAAAAVTVVTVAAVTVMAAWAHHLDTQDRNGGLWTYSAYASLVALLFAATIAAWTTAAGTAARRIEFPARVLRRCTALAVALTGTMAVVTGGTGLWWAAVASRAPSFLTGGGGASGQNPAPLELLVVGALMIAGLSLAVIGARRAAACARRMGQTTAGAGGAAC